MSVLDQIKNNEEVEFDEVIIFIMDHYDFTPTAFKNGDLENNANQNNGSCKVFAFSKLNGFTKEQTLQCFGDYYRKDVLQNPDGTNHGNIRNFISTGWDGISFAEEALTKKQ